MRESELPKVTFVSASGETEVVEIETGISLMEGAVSNGVAGIDAECGGNCYCGTCRVYIDAAWHEHMGPPGDYELPVIETTGDSEPLVRLSCQITVSDDLDGLTVRTPASQT